MSKNTYKNTDTSYPKLRPGESYFCIRYTGFGGKFKTVIGSKSKKEAREWFNLHYNATIISISAGTY